MCQFFEKRGYPASIVQLIELIDRQSSLQTSQKEHSESIPFTLTFHPHNRSVKSIILKNLLQNDPETGTIFSQPPLITVANLHFQLSWYNQYTEILIAKLQTGHKSKFSLG